MGFNISYLASRYSMAKLAEIYQIELSSAKSEIPYDSKSWMVELANGWTIWWSNSPNSFHLHGINPHKACPTGEACYALSTSEFCMHSSLTKYTASSKRWSITHHGDAKDKEHLIITGTPPQIFEALRDEVFDEQRNQTISAVEGHAVPDNLKAIVDNIGGTIAPFDGIEVDYVFDLPPRLGHHLFGFRYDNVPGSDEIIRCVEILGTEVKPKTQAANVVTPSDGGDRITSILFSIIPNLTLAKLVAFFKAHTAGFR